MRDRRLGQSSIPFPVAPHLPHYFDIKLIVSMSLELAIECFNNAKLSFYWKVISQDTLGCKWLQATWIGVSDGNGTHWPTYLKCPAEGLLWSWLDAGAQTPSSGQRGLSLSLLESSLHWLHLRQALPSSGPGQRPLAFVLPSHYPVKRASLSH